MIEKLTTQKGFEDSYLANMYAFRAGIMGTEEDQQAFYNKSKHTDNYAVYDDGRLTNQAINLPYTASVYGVPMKMGGIADVVTIPTERGKGVIKKIYAEIFADYFKNETIISYLAPFSHRFYRYYGYASGIEDQFVTIPKYELEKLSSEKAGSFYEIDRKNQADHDKLKDVYAETNEKKHGAFIRPDYWWDFIFAYYPNRHYILVYDEEKQAVGYLMYELEDSTSTFSMREFGYKNDFALKKIMTYLKNHTGSFETFIVKSSPYSKWYLLFDEPAALKITVEPTLMLRIVLLQQFIEKFPFVKLPTTASFVIEVDDRDCEWNRGKWLVEVTDGIGKISQLTEQKESDIKGSIEMFTQLFFNIETLENLLTYGKIKGKQERVAQFDRLIPKEKPYAYDHF